MQGVGAAAADQTVVAAQSAPPPPPQPTQAAIDLMENTGIPLTRKTELVGLSPADQTAKVRQWIKEQRNEGTSKDANRTAKGLLGGPDGH